MPLKYNNQVVKHISYNGQPVKRVLFNGAEVYKSTIPAQSGTWSHAALSSRQWTSIYNVELTGTALSAGHSGAYQYTISVPIYHSGSNANSYAVTVHIGATTDSQTVLMGTQNFTTSGKFTATVTSPVWLGDKATIYARIYLANANYLAVDSGAAFTLVCTDPESDA